MVYKFIKYFPSFVQNGKYNLQDFSVNNSDDNLQPAKSG